MRFIDVDTDGMPGSIQTPQILELSGIGDPTVLSTIGVEAKVDLPGVGANVQDHIFAGFVYGKRTCFELGLMTRPLNSRLLAELKEPEKYNTLDPLMDQQRLQNIWNFSTL